jgi:WD40 repeat protein/class 3 adenylate cyclase
MADGGNTPQHPAPDSSGPATRIVVMIFSDLVGSTALPAKFGAAAFAAALRLHNESFERLAEEEGVTIVKFTGDGYFAWCPSAASAVRFALRFQQAMREMAWGEVTLMTRMGIHLGEVSDITAAGRIDLIGSAANLASRIMSVGLGGQILLSRAPFDEGRLHVSAHPPCGNAPAPALEWLAHGPYRFNGYDEPIDVFEVGAKGVAPLIPPPDAEKARRALRPGDEETLGWRPAEGLEIPGRTGWRIAEKLGAGGFGEVWAGQHAKTRERRAFKFCFDAERLRALKREVTLTRLLRETLGDREDIVRIFDLRLDAPPYFLESELATDGNLLQWAEKQGGLAIIPLEARLELVAATAAALAAAHSVGVLHKDIKPTNVLIFTGKDGRARPRLVDFGIGTLADSAVLAQHGITGAGFTGATIQHSSGTPTYSPPEYLAGKPFTVQGDVYSLGVMLWQLATAKADQPLAEGWQRDVSDPLLREDIAACVDGDPARRLPSAADLATRLRALPERTAEAARRERQRRLRFTTAIATLIAAIAIPISIWALREKADALAQKEKADNAAEAALRSERNALAQMERADAERDRAKAQVREASRSDTATAQARLDEGKWQEAVAYLGRAIRYDPENRNAQDSLFLALRYGKRDAGRLPAHIFAHKAKVSSASFSPDGTLIVTASEDKTARIWKAKTGQPIGTPLEHKGWVSSASFSLDGTRIVTASWDNTARIWDTETGQPIGTPLEHKSVVRSASFSRDGTRIVTASSDGTARVWDATTGQPIGAPLEHKTTVWGATFSPAGTRIVTVSHDQTARIWDAKTSQPIGSPLEQTDIFSSTIFSPDGMRIVTASHGKTARIWDVGTGMSIGAPLQHEEGFRLANFSPGGTRIVTASWDNTVRIWDAKTGQPIGVPLEHNAVVRSASFSPDGTRIVTASRCKTARIWDAETGMSIGAPLQHEADVSSASFSPDGTRVVTVSYDGGTAQVWDVKSDQPIGGVPLHDDFEVSKAHFGPDGSCILAVPATDLKAQRAQLWNMMSHLPIGAAFDKGEILSKNFSENGARMVTTFSNNIARIWDMKTGLPIGVPLEHEYYGIHADFSADGAHIVTANGYKAQMWGAKTGLPIGTPLKHEKGIGSAIFSPDGTCIVTTANEIAQIWDTKTHLAVGTAMEHNPMITGAKFSPDGTRIVTKANKTAQIWDAKTAQPIGVLMEHEDFVSDVSFSDDGRRIVTNSTHTTARVWNAHSSQPISVLHQQKDTLNSARLSPDGTRVVTASTDGTLRIWDANSGQLIGIPLQVQDEVWNASFSPSGTCIVTVARGWDTNAQVWKVKSGRSLSPDLAETLINFLAGARLDPQLGSLQFLSNEERLLLWKKLEPALAELPDWRFVAERTFPNNP